MKDEMTVAEFERTVLEKEEVVITIRAPKDTKIKSYDYERKATGNQSISEFLDKRIKPLVGEHEVSIMSGDYSSPHGRTKVDTLRESYAK